MGRLKKTVLLLFAAAMFLLCACGEKALSWQEQYDLGVRYLSDGNYQEAVIAFEAAITIDAKRSESYLGAAEAYIAIGDIEAARNILEKGLEATSDVTIAEKLEELRDPFLNQDNFVSLDKFSQNSLTYITTMIDVMQQENLIEIHDFVLSEERRIAEIVAETSPIYQFLVEREGIDQIQYFGECHTTFVVEDYKADIWSYTGEDGLHYFGAEFHPEQGRGYYLYYTLFDDGIYNLTFLAGDCVDWNWDGPYWSYCFDHVTPETYGGGNSSYYEVMLYDGIYSVGVAKGGFKDDVETKREVGGLEMGVDDPLAEEPRIEKRSYFDENGKWVSTSKFGTSVTEEVYDNGRKMDTDYFQDYYFIPTGYMVEIEEYECALW